MRQGADASTPWDWSEAEVVLLGGSGQEISRTLGCHGRRQFTTALRAMYADLVQQPLPERLMDLLAELDQGGPSP